MSLIISGTTATGVTLLAANSPVTITASAYLTNPDDPHPKVWLTIWAH
jgi:hypothetical protein